jgi:hypothetical protein
MAIESAVMFRKVVRIACLVLVVGLLMSSASTAQLPIKTPAPVAVGSVIPFNHGNTGVWSQIYRMAIAPNGNIAYLDSAISNIYQLAPGASVPTLLVGPEPKNVNSDCSLLEYSGTYWNGTIAIDADNTLYVGDRYGSAVKFCRVPYANGAWIFQSNTNWAGGPQLTTCNPTCTTAAINPQDMIIGDDGTFYVSDSSSDIYKFKVTNGVAGVVTPVITNLKDDPTTVAVDHAGNLFFIENAYAAVSDRVTGILEIKAGSAPIAGDGTGKVEETLPRIDIGFNGIKGMTIDAWGNMYFGSENGASYGGLVDGVFMIPNEGTPTNPNLVWADTARISPVGTGFPVLIDPRGLLWIPDGGGGSNWGPAGSVSAACTNTSAQTIDATCTASSVVLWQQGALNAGASPVGTPGAPQTLFYSFSQPTTGNFVMAKPGASNFTVLTANPNPVLPLGPTPVLPCTSGTTYPAFSNTENTSSEYSWCQYFVETSSASVGSVSTEVQIDNTANPNGIDGSDAYVFGVGQGSAAYAFGAVSDGIGGEGGPAAVSIASGLSAPKQIAADPWGDSFVADSALKYIEEYKAGTTTPTPGAQLGTGLTAPTGVAVDGSGDLYIGDSGNIIEIPFINGKLATSQQTTLLTGLGDQLSLAADAQGDVFAADEANKQVVEVPNPQTSAMLANNPTLTLGAGFTGPSAIATDNSGNVWVADGNNLWEITMPWGGATEVTSQLKAPVTGLAVDPSGSVFVAQASGLTWIPYEASTSGLNIDGAIAVSWSTTAPPIIPYSVALDGSQNAYVSYGATTTAGVSEVGIGGSIYYGQIVPFSETDVEAQLFNVGNEPMDVILTTPPDAFTGANAADYSVGSASDTPACGPTVATAPGSFCYFDVALTPSAAGSSSASVSIQGTTTSPLGNAPSGINVALSALAVTDPRNATTTTLTVTTNPAGGAVYPGALTISVAVAAQLASNGTPAGNVTLEVSGQPKQTLPLGSDGTVTFAAFSNLEGGTYSAVADYGGEGVVGTAPDFAASGTKVKFIVATLAPTFTVSPPEGNASSLTVFNGNTFLGVTTTNTITASVTSSTGTPTGTISFQVGGMPVDPTQVSLPLNSSGNATFSTANLAQGVYNITAVYSGDVNFTSESIALPAFEVIVKSDEVTASPATLTVTPGTPGTVTLSLQPLVGFVADVSMQCVTASLPPYSECTFGYPGGGAAAGELPVGNNGPTVATTVTVTISTNVPVNGGTTTTSIARQAPWSLAGLFGLGLLGLIAGRKRLNRYLTMMCVALMLSGVFMGITACTNAGYSTVLPAPHVVTPAGTYKVQIITVIPNSSTQNSLTTPLFTLPVTVN